MPELPTPSVVFTANDFRELSACVAAAWRAGSEADWSRRAGTLEWTCLETADHAVDAVFAPAFFLASGRRDAYPDMGGDFRVGPGARPMELVQRLEVAITVLDAVVSAAAPDA